MSRSQLETTTTLEENFMFGSPPLLKGFAYTSCRSQESAFNYSNHESFLSKTVQNFDDSETCIESRPNKLCLKSKIFDDTSSTQKPEEMSMQRFHQHQLAMKNEIIRKVNGSLANEGINFIKRKDLRVLKSVLSKERFRQVVMKFGNIDDEGREILDSIHKTMIKAKSSSMKCVFCTKESEIYQNFPVVDGTLFLSPLQISKTSIKFCEKSAANRFMCFVCVNCMEGQQQNTCCNECGNLWNGSFFQIGTLYSYNILSALPCCTKRVSCTRCTKPIVDVANGEAASLFFSHFSTKVCCPHCKVEDYHFVKSLTYSLNSSVNCG